MRLYMSKRDTIKDDLNKNLVRFKRYKVRTDIPKDLQIAIQTFVEATIMVGEQNLDHMPGEYLANLMLTLMKYPEYKDVLTEIIRDSGLEQ